MNSTTEFANSKDDYTSDERLKQNLDIIIDAKYKNNITDWIYYAKPNEKKGLYILSKVVKHRGQKLFKTQLIKTKDEEKDLSKLTLEEAYKRYQKKKNVSSYSDFYGGNVDDKYKYNSILKYKDFANVKFFYKLVKLC
jgi:hypothetical protein